MEIEIEIDGDDGPRLRIFDRGVLHAPTIAWLEASKEPPSPTVRDLIKQAKSKKTTMRLSPEATRSPARYDAIGLVLFL